VSAVVVVAGKEIRECLRNRWLLAATLLLAGLALTLTFLGSAPTGSVGVPALDVVIVSLSSLTIFLIPLIALLISHDAIIGEIERGTMLLLLSHPVARWQVVIGKFVGHLGVLAFSTLVGYGAAALALWLTAAAVELESWLAFATMIGTSVLLGAVFVAIGYLISALAKDRGTAAGLAIGVWLALVLIYDMALLGLLVADQGKNLSGGILSALLLFNPTDVYRLLNLAGSSHVSLLSGMAGVSGVTALQPAMLLGTLAAWAILPLTLAALAFSQREL
jgi:Cu-processing system permease protein